MDAISPSSLLQIAASVAVPIALVSIFLMATAAAGWLERRHAPAEALPVGFLRRRYIPAQTRRAMRKRKTLQIDDLIEGERYWLTYALAGQIACYESFVATFQEFHAAHRGLLWCIFVDSNGTKHPVASRYIKELRRWQPEETKRKEPPAGGEPPRAMDEEGGNESS